MDSYWDLYVAYVPHCVEYNRKHDIDPHHYEMEWNHFLPRCIFGDQPIGHYLLLKQHAIASALQTLAFQQNCLCGWHKKYLPKKLIERAWDYYSEAGRKTGEENKTLRRGICNPDVHKLKHVVESKRQNGIKVSKRFMEESLGLFDPKFKKKILEAQVKTGNKAVEEKTGIHDPKHKQLVLEAGRTAIEKGLGIFDPKNKQRVLEGSKKAGKISINQKWKSTIDGYVSTAPAVANHNRKNGWDPDARIRIA